MSKPRVFITRKIFPEWIDEIRSVADPIRVPSNFLAGISELKVKI